MSTPSLERAVTLPVFASGADVSSGTLSSMEACHQSELASLLLVFAGTSLPELLNADRAVRLPEVVGRALARPDAMFGLDGMTGREVVGGREVGRGRDDVWGRELVLVIGREVALEDKDCLDGGGMRSLTSNISC